MKFWLTILGCVLVIATVAWYSIGTPAETAEASARQLVHDAIQADLDGNYTKSCTLYQQILAQRIEVDRYEQQYLEDACKHAH